MTDILASVILPVFALVLVGYVAGKGGILSPDRTRGLVSFLMYIAFPALLFRNVSSGFEDPAEVSLIAVSYIASTLFLYCGAFSIAKWVLHLDGVKQCLYGMGASFSNSIMLGTPVAFFVFGESAMTPLSVIIFFNTVVLIGGTSVLIELNSSNDQGAGLALRGVVASLLKNPIIIAAVLGFIWAALRLPTGVSVDRLLEHLDKAVLPCGLVALGAAMTGVRSTGRFSETIGLAALKLFIHPLLTWVVATLLFGLRGDDRNLVVLVAALPLAGNVFLLAQKYDTYVDRIGSGFIVSTAVSILTLTMLIGLINETWLATIDVELQKLLATDLAGLAACFVVLVLLGIALTGFVLCVVLRDLWHLRRPSQCRPLSSSTETLPRRLHCRRICEGRRPPSAVG